ncbi:MAG: ATP-binding protein, partial [Thermodesulfobacteriota bacterium]
LEIRRFEKNFFLYGDKDSLTTAFYHLNRVKFLLDKNTEKIGDLSTPERTEQFKAALTQYKRLLVQCSQSTPAARPAAGTTNRVSLGRSANVPNAGRNGTAQTPNVGTPKGSATGRSGREIGSFADAPQVKASDARPDCEGAIRKLGTAMAEFAETVARKKRGSIKETMDDAVTLPWVGLLVAGVGLVAIGSFLFTKVTRSLRLLEIGTGRIARGAFEPIQALPVERDIRNILTAFNTMAGELREREEQLVQSRKLASLGTMLAGVAHEVNNPLSNISSSCEILLEELDESDTEFQRTILVKVIEQVEKARRLILNLLEFSRTKELDEERVNLKETIEKTLALLEAEKPPGVRVKVELEDRLFIRADRPKIEQVFTNLISNAFQAIEGEGEVKIRALAKRDGTVKIRISDSGKGISDEDLPKVFDPFFTTKDVGKGTGLGLFITHDIILRHQGTIQVKSAPDKGTVFCIRLPAAETSQ